MELIKCPFVAGVDSGQAGIFDISHYRIPDADDLDGSADTDSEWYLAYCNITENSEEAVS